MNYTLQFLDDNSFSSVLSLRKTTNAAIYKVGPTTFTDRLQPQSAAHHR